MNSNKLIKLYYFKNIFKWFYKIAKNINKFSQAKTDEINRFMESLRDYLEINNN
jgi:hypothetical protein